MEYKTIQGEDSKEHAENWLDKYWEHFNENKRTCPLMSSDCCTYDCSAWVKAKVYLSNRGRMHEHQSIYDIREGYCNSPMITGTVTIEKGY